MTNSTVNEFIMTAQNIFDTASGALEAMNNAVTRDECIAAQESQQLAADYSREFKAGLVAMVADGSDNATIKIACNEFITEILTIEGWTI